MRNIRHLVMSDKDHCAEINRTTMKKYPLSTTIFTFT